MSHEVAELTEPGLDALPGPGQRRRELLQDLVAASWRAGECVLPSGVASPYFIVAEQFLTKVTILRRLASMLADLVPVDVDRIVCCLPGPDVVFGAALALETGLPLVLAQADGEQETWLGELHPGESVVIAQGVVSSGATAEHAVRDMLSRHVRVTSVVAAVDRDEGARDRIHGLDVGFTSLFAARELLEVATYGRGEPGT